ncbi:MAG: tRNA (adenosine(37)-N6)-threonylcarbamoyltransferase complex ATPase subunit type 1 TsaE, partial [Oscillochloris sp.]|nr:tRNA (adenosine(37)-N6)-threonylcarbamoyltransferase complex ATPase subunit type 1 TsaE [Oscillochloris sp.]
TASAQLPAEYLAIQMQHLSETKRRLRMAPYGRRYAELLGAFKGTAFG